MKYNSYLTLKAALLTTSIITSALSTSAQAELIEYKYNGIDLVYSTVSDVSWLKDADLLCTMTKRDGVDATVNKIINANGGKLQDGSSTVEIKNWHLVGVTTTDNCRMSLWHGAMAFIKYLNLTSYGGLNTWQLPTANATENPLAAEYNAAAKNVVNGYNGPFNGTVSGNEFPELFYKELGAVALYNTNGHNNTGIGIHKSPSALKVFNNLKWGYSRHEDGGGSFDGYAREALYWTQSSSQRSNQHAFSFTQFTGLQGYSLKLNSGVSPTPPGIAWPIIAGKPKNFYQLATPRAVQVKAAFYGVEGKPTWEIKGLSIADRITRAKSNNNMIYVPAKMNDFFEGDPLPNQPKIVAVQVQWGSLTLNLRQKEGKELMFPGVEGEDFWVVP